MPKSLFIKAKFVVNEMGLLIYCSYIDFCIGNFKIAFDSVPNIFF